MNRLALLPPIEPLETRITPAAVAVVELSALTGVDGFQINGEALDSSSLFSVSGAGDVNGDGFGDIIIGIRFADPNGSNSGASYVVFGRAGGFAANLELSALNGSDGFQINGEAAGDNSGDSVSEAGDVNGDGFDDLLIGAFGADPNASGSGASYVVFGRGGFAANLELSTLDGSNGFQINGETAGDRAGLSASGAGDVNGDGFDDLIIGALFADPNGSSSGAGYVVFGKADGFAATLELSTLNGSNGFQINGEAADDESGGSVSGAGDVNGDGFDDLIIGARLADPNGANSGASYVVFGQAGSFGAVLELSALDGSNGFQINGEAAGDLAGRKVSKAGDVNGDGFDDLLIAKYRATPDDSGTSYVVFGRGTADVVVAANGKSATFTGWDGDRVTIKTSRGTLDAAQFKLSSPNPLTGGAHLIYADFSTATNGGEFTKANLSFTAKRGPTGGDGLVNVGTIDARGTDLGKVSVDGDLQQIDGGVTALTVYSLGLAADAEVKGGPLTSELGTVGALTVKTTASRVTLAAITFGAIKALNLDGVTIYAEGFAATKASEATALKSLTVAGDVRDSQFLLGRAFSSAAVLNPDVRVGAVKVGGNWIASDLIVGVRPGDDGIYATGDANESAPTTGSALVSRIASIVIKGAVLGTAEDVRDGFGFAAQEIGSFTLGKAKLPLTKKPGNDLTPFVLALTGDVRVREGAV
ncbi:MAG: integrin alpha [Chthoniobacteraceae bacterium]